MGNLLDVLGGLVLQYWTWRYLILILGFIAQEEITIVVGVYLITRGYLGWSNFLITIIAALIIYEMFFYITGRYVQNTRFGRFMKRKIPHYARVQFQLHKNATFFLIISRFVAYLNSGVLFLSGLSKIKLSKLIIMRIIANVIWIGGLILLSYFSLSTMSYFLEHRIEIAIILILVIIFTAQHLIKKALLEGSIIEENAEKIGGIIEKETESQK